MRKSKSEKQRGLNIVIIGCGKVGVSLVEKLSQENHNITVIDTDPEKVRAVTDAYDVIGVVGNGASFEVQSEAGIDDTDILISVTQSDELNLLCCILAKRASNCETIARVRTPDYSDEAGYLKEKLGLAMVVNPERASAAEIFRILRVPTALGVSSFGRGRADMIRVQVPPESILTGNALSRLEDVLAGDVLICAVERGDELYIPDGSFVILAGDIIDFICPSRDSVMLLKRFGFETSQVHDALIVGGGRTCLYLSKMLLNAGIRPRIIERDIKRCEVLSSLLPSAIVINGDGTDEEVLKEARIDQVQAVVSMTGIDEENIMLTLYAQSVSKAKLITKIDRSMFPEAVAKLKLGSLIRPKFLTTDAILAFVRSRSASKGSNIEHLVRLFDNRGEAVEFLAQADSPVIDIPLKDLQTRDHLLIACINRDGKAIIPSGSECIREGDLVIIVTTHTGLRELEDILK